MLRFIGAMIGGLVTMSAAAYAAAYLMARSKRRQ